MRVLELKETECEWLKPADLAPALLDDIPPIFLFDLGDYCDGKFSGYCPTWPIFAKEAGGEIVIDSALADPRRPRRTRRKLIAITLHEIAHRLTPEEIEANQAHGAVFGAVCFALTSRCIGIAESKSHFSLYDIQDAQDKGAAFAFAIDFASRHRESGIPARDLPGLARAEWAALSSRQAQERAAAVDASLRAIQAEREARAAEGVADQLRVRLARAACRLADLDAEKDRKAKRIRKIRPFLEIGSAAAFLALLVLIY